MTAKKDPSIPHGNRTHGMFGTRTYNAWAGMLTRVRHKPKGYENVELLDDRWANFEAFHEDMGLCPEGMTLDRFPDNAGGYGPGNCRWATPAEQSRNRRFCHVITHNGKTQTLAEWGRELGIPKSTLHRKLVYRGLSFEEAISG